MSAHDVRALIAAHKRSIRHRAEILESERCGCFYCLATYSPDEITEWTDEGQTALCPRCEIDSVIGDRSGYPVHDQSFLTAMKEHWFAPVDMTGKYDA